MAGHSHSANIAHRKGLVDAKRGKLFSKLCRAIYVAARNGGGDPDANLRLRYAIDKARSYSCPKDNIERSIKKATGELGAENFEEVIYEGYGPGGVAVLCEALTDNRNRTAGELRKAFEVCGGNLGASGCVSYLFNYKGLFVVDAKHVAEDRLMEVALEAGADDLERVDDYFEVTCDPKVFDAVRKALEDAQDRHRERRDQLHPDHLRSTSTSRTARGCSSSATSSTRTRTSRTSTPTTTSPRRSWRAERRSERGAGFQPAMARPWRPGRAETLPHGGFGHGHGMSARAINMCSRPVVAARFLYGDFSGRVNPPSAGTPSRSRAASLPWRWSIPGRPCGRPLRYRRGRRSGAG